MGQGAGHPGDRRGVPAPLLAHRRGVLGYNTNAKMNPPLRTAEDVEAIREALKDGTIDVIATDHAPHHYDAKEREFDDAPNGIIGLETALAVSVTNLVETGHIDFPTLVDKMSCAPAKIFGLPGGSLAKGSVADITVFDPKMQWEVDPAEFLTKGRNTPYSGMTLTGRAICTLVGGSIVHRLGKQSERTARP